MHERLDLVHAIWDSIGDHPDAVLRSPPPSARSSTAPGVGIS